MKALLQRVTSASVTVIEDGRSHEAGRVGPGLVVFVAVERGDGPADVRYIAAKVCDLRVFEDPLAPDRRMTRSMREHGGGVLIVSNFTLAADCRRGRRPSFDRAAPPDVARPIYEAVVRAIETAGVQVAAGHFQATMQVALVNDGPVAVWLDSRQRAGAAGASPDASPGTSHAV